MFKQIRRRRILVAAFAGAALAALATVASSRASVQPRELFESASQEQVQFGPRTAGTTYRASLVRPAPTVWPAVSGWLGTQYVSHAHGKVAYETASLLWHDYAGRELDIVSGPAMTLSPVETLARPRSRIPQWNFSPYERPSPVKRWTVAGRQAVYFDATAPPPGVWTL